MVQPPSRLSSGSSPPWPPADFPRQSLKVPGWMEGGRDDGMLDCMDSGSDTARLTAALREFADERRWGQFHRPKNLAMALGGEAGELLAELQWFSDDEVTIQLDGGDLRARLEDEVADVLIYLLRFADVTGIDPVSAAWAKIERNEERYPVELARGNARKYTDLAKDGQDPQP